MGKETNTTSLAILEAPWPLTGTLEKTSVGTSSVSEAPAGSDSKLLLSCACWGISETHGSRQDGLISSRGMGKQDVSDEARGKLRLHIGPDDSPPSWLLDP